VATFMIHWRRILWTW